MPAYHETKIYRSLSSLLDFGHAGENPDAAGESYLMCAFGPTLRGNKISLRPPRLEDLPTYQSWLENLEVTRYLLRRSAMSDAQEREWYDRMSTSDTSIVWRIVAGETTVGNTGIHGIDWINRRGETGLMIGDTSSWGKGYASEAVELRTSFAFEELGLERLGSESFVQNVPMHRALEKSGYRKIGTMRHFAFRGGAWHDLYVFELLREDWLTRNA